MSRFQVIQGGEVLGMGIADYVWLPHSGKIQWKKKSVLISRDDKGNPTPILDRWVAEDLNEKVILVPCHYLPDPTRPQPHFIVLCEARDFHDIPLSTEHRSHLREQMESIGDACRLTWFGFGQHYILRSYNGTAQIGDADWVAERHFGACFDAGLLIHSMQPGKFKVGVRDFPQDIDPDPPSALVVTDHLIMARHLLTRIAMEKNLYPVFGELDMYVSTAALREPGADFNTIVPQMVKALANVTQGSTPESVPHPTRGGVQCIRARNALGLANPHILAQYSLMHLHSPTTPQE